MPVLFDVDDTLIDHRGAERSAALALLRRFREWLDYPDEVFVTLWHSAAERHFASFTAGECSYQEQRRRRIREFFSADLSDQAADERFDTYYQAYRQNWMLFPDVLPCLDALAGETLAIISNNSTEATRTKLETVGIAGRFVELVTPENAGVSKPDPRIFRAACDRLGVPAAPCLYVGDLLEEDARAAQSAGLTGVWLQREPKNAGADLGGILVIHDLRDLPALLRGRKERILMKALFIGGTGNISVSVSRLAVERGIDLVLLNRGRTPVTIVGATSISADITQAEQVQAALSGHHFDAVVDWIAFREADIERDLKLFRGNCGQFIFISSASAYQKPLAHPVITESTPLANPFWQYSRDKIACEDRLMRAYREDGFPMTVVRPSHTYDTRIPVAVGNWARYLIPHRMLEGRPVVVHGDGTSLWTLTHSEDFARGFVGLLGHPQAIGHAFHLTSDFVLTWNQINEQIGDALGVKPEVVHIPSEFIAQVEPEIGAGLLGDKMWSVIFDNSKIKRLVPDYVARIPFHEGIRRTLAWYQADPDRMKVTPEDDARIDRILDAYQGTR